MRELWNKIKTWKPPLLLCSLLALLTAAAALALVSTDYEKEVSSVILYAVYVCSAIAVTVEIWAIAVAARNKSPLKVFSDMVHQLDFTGKLYDDYSFRTVSFAYPSLIANLFFAASKGVAGWWFSSWWLVSLAAYYGLLCMIKFALLRANRKIMTLQNQANQTLQEWKAYRFCGILLMCMTVILQGIVILIVNERQTFTYDGLLIYAVATYDFYCLTVAVIYMVKNRKRHSPIVVAIKSVSASASLVSILSLQTAMFASFGASQEEKQQTMNLLTGTGVCALMLLFGLYMLLHAKKQIKKIKLTIDEVVL